MGRFRKRSAHTRLLASLATPTNPLTPADHCRIRYTQRLIHATFSHRKELSVFDMYFAVRYQLMNVSDIPAIRVFRDNRGKLWSVDNRRLWVMKNAGRGFNCKGVYTRKQDPIRFKEVEYKIRSLCGTDGEHVEFQSCEFRDSNYQCCVQALEDDKLDAHIANDHLNLDLEQITLLTRCPVHCQDHTSCTCLSNSARGTLKQMIDRQCETLKQVITSAQLQASKEHVELFERLKGPSDVSSSITVMHRSELN